MTDLVAAFPMYQRPELGPAFDTLWSITRDLLRAEGVVAPEALTVVDDDLLSFWKRPDLLLSQTCGFPFRHFLKDCVTLVGSPDFRLEGCPPGYFRSALVVRHDDPRKTLREFQGATLVCNDIHSQSGYAAPLVAASRAGLSFGRIITSGAHIASARMVAGGLADITAIDAISWRHISRFDLWANSLRVLCWTEPTPGLPFITAFAPMAPTLGRCLAQAIQSMPRVLRDHLTLQGLVRIEAGHYLSVADAPDSPHQVAVRFP